MEVKKSPKADLQNKKSIFFLCGLVLSILFVIGLFSWSKSEIVIDSMSEQSAVVEQEEIVATQHEEQKVEAPKIEAPILSDVLTVVADNIQVSTNMDIFSTEANENQAIVIKKFEAVAETIDDADVPVIKAEKDPTFQGGTVKDFRDWVFKRIVYPAIATENNISGKVVLTFVIERDGSVSNIKTLVSPDNSLSEEAIRVVKQSPKWTPGLQRGKPVRVTVNVPIDFILN